MTSREFQDRLSRRARRARVALNADLADKLEVYYRLLTTWNQKINLTGLELGDLNPGTLDRLLVEPLVAAQYVNPVARRAIDIGSGGGSPAVPLALALPRMHMVMVEAKTRKSVFLREVTRALNLNRAEIRTARYEELLSSPDLHEAHDLLTIRAVRIEPKTLMSLQAFVRPGAEMFLFRAAGATRAPMVTPPLAWRATYPLLESTVGALVVLEKRSVGGERRHVSRETT